MSKKAGWRNITERNAAIIKRYAKGTSTHKLGEEFGLCKERVCQICREAGVIRKRGRPYG